MDQQTLPQKNKRKLSFSAERKQRKVIKAVKEGKTMKAAMLGAGYSESASNAPKVITKTKTWKGLMQEYFPDELLAERHRELLNKRDYKIIKKDHYDDEGKKLYTEEVLQDIGPETAAVTKSLEMSYKLKGAFKEAATTDDKSVKQIYNLFYVPEVRASLTSFEDTIKKQIMQQNGKVKRIVGAVQEGGEAVPNGADGGGDGGGGEDEVGEGTGDE